ncbi:GerAB/ArcD/ProY family transporter [Virgibacillus ainsalahensis]
MDINIKIKENLRIQAFYLFFIISSIQIGVGIMGAPRIIFIEAHQDSWIAILIAAAYIILVLFVMLLILKQYDNADILGIQVDVFGKLLGKLLGTVYIIYFAVTLFSVLITYIEVVNIFIFPSLSPVVMGTLLIILIAYSVLGGLKVIVGVCFLFFIFSNWVFLLLIEPATEIDWTHYQPAFQASFTELINGAKSTAYTFIGFEILLFIYPFIQNKQKAKLPVFAAVLWSAFIVFITTFIAIGFFSPGQLERREWSLLSLFKIQTFSFIERMDFVVVAEWMMVIIPNMILLMWGIIYGMKRLYRIPQKTSLYIVSGLLLIGTFFSQQHFQIQKIIDTTDKIGFWIVFVYPFLLLPLVLIKKKWRKRKEGDSHAK